MNVAAVNCVKQFLLRGRNGCWAWETCVEDAATCLGHDALARPEIVTAIAREFQRQFPCDGRRAKNVAIWQGMRIDSTAADIVSYIRDQFNQLSSFGDDLSSERAKMQLHSRLDSAPEPAKSHLRALVDCEFRNFPGDDHTIPRQAGIYAIWRGKHHGSLSYVGESGNRSSGMISRLWTYLPGGSYPWWGRTSMVVTFCAATELTDRQLRKEIESLGISILQPSSQFVG